METMQSIVLIGHTLVAVLIIVLVLLQRGKGADAGAAFGSGASGTVFGARGSSSFFSRATGILATIFFISSLTLAYMSSQHSSGPESLLENAPSIEVQTQSELIEIDESSDAGEIPELPELEDSDLSEDDIEMPLLELEESIDDASNQ
jgi:preprotein translocase subunit SecG